MTGTQTRLRLVLFLHSMTAALGRNAKAQITEMSERRVGAARSRTLGHTFKHASCHAAVSTPATSTDGKYKGSCRRTTSVILLEKSVTAYLDIAFADISLIGTAESLTPTKHSQPKGMPPPHKTEQPQNEMSYPMRLTDRFQRWKITVGIFYPPKKSINVYKTIPYLLAIA